MKAHALRAAVIAAQARAVNVQYALEQGDVGTARRELGKLDDQLAQLGTQLDDEVNRERNT
jgi:hypothetical protein